MTFENDMVMWTFKELQAEFSEPRSLLEPCLKGMKHLRDALFSSVARRAHSSLWSNRTIIEKAVVVVALGAVGYATVKYGVVQKLVKIPAMIVPAVKYVSRMGGPVQVVQEPEACTRGNTLESRRAGSDEATLTTPVSQARVGFMRDGQFVVIGSCVRFDDNYLIGPDHVLGEEGDKWVYGRQNRVSLTGRERVPIDTDLVAIKMTEAEMSKIGVSVCKIGPLGPSVYAQIVGPMGKGTTGALQADRSIFGRVTYSGTTISGYSGSAYTAGAQTLGIHQNGGVVNGGYSASYAWMKLKQVLNVRLEASEDWLLGQFKAGKKVKWQHAGEPGYVQVFADGLYSTVETASMQKAFGKGWDKSNEIDRDYIANYDDHESIPANSGEANSSGLNTERRGASSVLDSTQDLEQQHLQNLTNAYVQLSANSRKKFRNSQNLQVRAQQAMSGLVSQ